VEEGSVGGSEIVDEEEGEEVEEGEGGIGCG
jgi:hypothetical protein